MGIDGGIGTGANGRPGGADGAGGVGATGAEVYVAEGVGAPVDTDG